MNNTNTKKMLLGIFALLIGTFMLAFFPTEAEAEIYEDTIRLHILANSDSDEDQELKLKIRDRMLSEYGSELGASDFEEAKSKISKSLSKIEADINLWLKELNSSYSAKATLTEEWYDTREYEGFALPEGKYTSLRIIIGEGAGKNWWCVMYPPLCMDIATERAPADDGLINYSKEEIRLIQGGKYNIKFKVLETFSSIFMKKG